MFKPMKALCHSFIGSLCILSPQVLLGDQPGTSSEDSTPIFEEILSHPSAQEAPTVFIEETPKPTTRKAKASIKPFTGKVKGKKVRLRLQPDLESSVVKELQRGELLTVVEEAEDFYAVEPPSNLKAYVFRSFVLDDQIEGNRVNIRLQPNLEAPVVTHMNSGDKVQTTVCASNNKWYEIAVPSSARFYVAKEFIENCGGPEVKAQHEAHFTLAKQQMEMAEYFAENEMKKDYPSIDFDKMNHNFQVIIKEFSEFADLVEQARNCLAKAQEQFLDKRIAYLENKAIEEEAIALETKKNTDCTLTDKMKLWQPLEEALYLSWATTSQAGNLDQYYEEQKLAADRITGILEPYLAPVKCKPGDYILRQNDLPVGYVYSTVVNLQNFVGKKVTLVSAPRPNNNFAFPAYFVFGVED